MPLISGTHKCTSCGKDLFWEYPLPDQFDNANAFQFTKGSLRPIPLNDKQSKTLEFRIKCAKCNYTNDFTYDNHIYHNATKLRQKHF